MTEVENIALWVGLIASIVGIVLSIVAIVFSILVEKSSRAVNEQMIRSLQKIESEVERSSGDTRELIKVGWEKMLSSVNAEPNLSDEPASKALASGIASELRVELGLLREEAGTTPISQSDESKKLDEYLDTFESALTAQFSAQNVPEGRGAGLDRVYSMVKSVSEEAKALLVGISRFHLERREYNSLILAPLEMLSKS